MFQTVSATTKPRKLAADPRGQPEQRGASVLAMRIGVVPA